MNSDNPPAQGKGAIVNVVVDHSKDSDLWRRTAVAAYFRAEARGFVPGYELEDWLLAERELDAAIRDAMKDRAAVTPIAAPPPKKKAKGQAVLPTVAETPKKAAKRTTRSRKDKSGGETQLGGMG